MSSPDPRYPTIGSPEYSNTASAQEKILKATLKVIADFKEEVNNSLKESKDKKIGEN